MELIHELFGQGSNLDVLQMITRSIAIFFIAFLLIRFTGMRLFGMKSAFDVCVTIILGAVLARATVGVSPFIPVIFSSLALVIVHKIIAAISVNIEK